MLGTEGSLSLTYASSDRRTELDDMGQTSTSAYRLALEVSFATHFLGISLSD